MKIEEAKNQFHNWFNINSVSLKQMANKNIQEGKNLVLGIENDLLYEAKFKPISFLYSYYQYLKNPEFGSNKILIYSSEHSFNLDFNLDSNLFTVENKKGFELYVNGFLEDRINFRNGLDEKLKPIILKSTNPSEVQRAFLIQELALSDFKEEYRYYRYRNYRYYDFGPFHWLRKEKFFNPGSISRKLNNNRLIQSERSRTFSRKKYCIDNSEKFQRKIKDNIQDLNSVSELNDRIKKNNYSNPSNQPFVKNKQEPIKKMCNDGVIKNQSETSRMYSSESDKDQVLKKSFEVKDSGEKHLKTKTRIYILLTPFQFGEKIEIKVGESTNIKSRIDTYRQYWRDKFKVVFISEGLVEDEKKLKLKLEKFHDSNEFFRVDIKTMQIISKSTSFHELLQNLELYS